MPDRISSRAYDPISNEPEPACIERYFVGLEKLLHHLPAVSIDRAVEALLTAYHDGRSVFLFGNGGSAALASHFACDLGKGTALNHFSRFRVLALTDNIPLITAWANDVCYDDIFAEQLRNLVEPKDVAFAISGSGNSTNVLNGLRVARQEGATSIVLTGFQGGQAAALADLCIIVPSDDMQYIEDLHLSIAHSIFRAVRKEILERAHTPAKRARAADSSAG